VYMRVCVRAVLSDGELFRALISTSITAVPFILMFTIIIIIIIIIINYL
jgi:hypothetical protein